MTFGMTSSPGSLFLTSFSKVDPGPICQDVGATARRPSLHRHCDAGLPSFAQGYPGEEAPSSVENIRQSGAARAQN
ncbi:unnamed protein product [Pleuronectes platessa]|uniref:Uncharacterized protein n=1 Tax=Pleuronectes platessa TaxID=8262 RepID=A0A9N7VQW1_PLEPL|nr:unnamed protein product [Pleuronectes platessa]